MKLAVAVLALTTAACATRTAEIPPPAPIPMPESTATTVGPPPPPPAPTLPSNWSGMQWMYGSGEGAVAAIQVYLALTDHVLAAARRRPRESVVLNERATPERSSFVPCGAKPLAVIFDTDETLIQNLGYEYALAQRGITSGGPLLRAYQTEERSQSTAMPGASEALAKLRAANVTPIINTGRDKSTAAGTAATLARAGLGRFVHGETLFLRGDIDSDRGKDSRRRYIAERYCVVAMAGDQLGDFWDVLNDPKLQPLQRRALASTGRVGAMWGQGWFLIANPVYGPAINGSIDEIFAPDVRWNGEQ